MNKVIRMNDADEVESVMVYLSKENTPVAYQNKLDELMDCNAFDTQSEAEKWLSETPIELELYYEKGYGLFGVEAEAVESDNIHSPYSDAQILNEDDIDPNPEDQKTYIITDYHADEKMGESFIRSIMVLANDPTISSENKAIEIKAMIMHKLFNK